ncbi:TraA family conjugative transfer protein [Psychromonas sp. KJ10-2]|uniref:TraA family conjugative transfer protein n=1 Tax=Psychromonas sp. KJ10-2 TaxID=3391822 RepID=UPI0039B6482C
MKFLQLDEQGKQDLKNNALFFTGLLVLSVIMASMAHAGTDATFDAWVDQLTEWVEGSLGKGVSIAFVVIGIIMGIASQTLKAVAIGVGCALGLNFTPTVIDGMFTAIL